MSPEARKHRKPEPEAQAYQFRPRVRRSWIAAPQSARVGEGRTLRLRVIGGGSRFRARQLRSTSARNASHRARSASFP